MERSGGEGLEGEGRGGEIVSSSMNLAPRLSHVQFFVWREEASDEEWEKTNRSGGKLEMVRG